MTGRRYEPAATVLPEYTDEALKAQTWYPGSVAEQLLRVPPWYRQPVEVEVQRRTTRTGHVRTKSGLLERHSELIGDPSEAREAVVAEVLAQLAADAEEAA